MPILRNTGSIARILPVIGGDYVRLSPGCVSANIEVDLDNPVILAWMAAGDIAEVKKPSKPKQKAVKPDPNKED